MATNELAVVMAKLSGIRKSLSALLVENISNRSGVVRHWPNFAPVQVEHLFVQAAAHMEALRRLLPDWYGDFAVISTEPALEMAGDGARRPPPMHFARTQVEWLVRDIDQIFEIRANSELEQTSSAPLKRVFVSHGRSEDWRKVQPFIEKDIELPTLELAQEPNLGRTLIEKLIDAAAACDSAVIVMTGDDIVGASEARVRENVMHEVGYFQGRYGRGRVVLMYEEGVNIPTNLSGVAYVPFPKGNIEAGFHVLQRELKAIHQVR